MASQQQSSNTPHHQRDCWQTPQWLFDYVAADQGPFDVDLAASVQNAKVDQFLTLEDNSLKLNWGSLLTVDELGCPKSLKSGWCNPPYSETGKWLEKGKREAQYGFKSVFLIPTPNGEIYWRHVFGWASEIIFINGRISFELPDENGVLMPKAGNTRGSCIVVFDGVGEQDTMISWIDRDVIKASQQQPSVKPDAA